MANFKRNTAKGSERKKMELNQSLDKIVKVRGYKDGLLFIIQPESTLSEIEEALSQQLSSLGASSLSGIGITLDTGSRAIKEEHLHNLQEWLKQEYGMDIKRIIMDYPKTTTQLPQNPRQILTESFSRYISAEPIFTKPKQVIEQKPEQVIEQEEEKTVETPEERARIIRQTLRSGQREEFLEGDLVVLGDVNPGAEIVALKDIIVLGSLRGIAHAGVLGDTSAVIIALNLAPTQLRIGNIVSRSPGEEMRRETVMEIARVEGESVVVEEYKGL